MKILLIIRPSTGASDSASRSNVMGEACTFHCRMIRGYVVFAIGVVALLTIQPDYSIAAGVTQTYQYDSLGRLVGTWDTLNIHSQTTYDAASNRSTVAVTNEPLPPPADTSRLHVRQVRSPSTGKTITIVTP